MSYTYNTISLYLESKESTLERIKAIELLIDAMVLKMADVTGGQNSIVNEYWMNDGQMSVKTSYRSINEVQEGIKSLEKMKQIYVNRYNGRDFVLRDVRGINH